MVPPKQFVGIFITLEGEYGEGYEEIWRKERVKIRKVTTPAFIVPMLYLWISKTSSQINFSSM